ncbi:DUF2607 family protein [Photobacterium nomapromontoriensis]|uniref:DUF2607 family protein n=1 Tax=Photobacterium nomapromontoriensis TaxID=2910237 RepID=UPI003D108C83
MSGFRTHNITSRYIAIYAIFLAIWLNFAVVSHQLDVTPSHHLHHQCELFSAAQNGLSQVVPLLNLTPQSEDFVVTFSTEKAKTQHFAYHARSPPSL